MAPGAYRYDIRLTDPAGNDYWIDTQELGLLARITGRPDASSSINVSPRIAAHAHREGTVWRFRSIATRRSSRRAPPTSDSPTGRLCQ